MLLMRSSTPAGGRNTGNFQDRSLQSTERTSSSHKMLNTKSVRRTIGGLFGIAACLAVVGCSNGSSKTKVASPTLFVTDGVSNRVVQITDVNTAVWTPLGTLGSGTGQFNRP